MRQNNRDCVARGLERVDEGMNVGRRLVRGRAVVVGDLSRDQSYAWQDFKAFERSTDQDVHDGLGSWGAMEGKKREIGVTCPAGNAFYRIGEPPNHIMSPLLSITSLI